MLKGSGINYFVSQNGLNDLWDVFYTFESGNTSIPSVSGANSLFSGDIIGDISSFWSKQGSGLFTGAYVSVNNHTGLAVNSFTHLLSFQELGTGKQLLYSNIDNYSGYEIGLTDTKKLYVKTNSSDGPVVIASNFNLSSKNLISLSYLSNSFQFGYYNFNAQSFEIEEYTALSNKIISNNQAVLGSGFNGYIDYYLYFNLLIDSEVMNSIVSGFYNIPTGYNYETETVCSEIITGYESVPYFTSGITGYQNVLISSDGAGDYTGLFPTSGVSSGIMGLISSGYVQSGLTQIECITYTGAATIGYETLTGYVNSFQMNKVLYFDYLDSSDLIKFSKETTPFTDFYNKNGIFVASGFLFATQMESGKSNIFVNGVAYTNSGAEFRQNLILNEFYSYPDQIIVDIASGDKLTAIAAPYMIEYNAQEIFFNGVNLISGRDFSAIGGEIILTGQNTGISGILFEFPILLSYETGNKNNWEGSLQRNSARLYLNGIRQFNKQDYIEGSNFDLLMGNLFNKYNNFAFYDNNGTFWE